MAPAAHRRVHVKSASSLSTDRRSLDPQAQIGCLGRSEGVGRGASLCRIAPRGRGESGGVGGHWLRIGPRSPDKPSYTPELQGFRLTGGSRTARQWLPGAGEVPHADQNRRRLHALGDRRPGRRDCHRASQWLVGSDLLAAVPRPQACSDPSKTETPKRSGTGSVRAGWTVLPSASRGASWPCSMPRRCWPTCTCHPATVWRS